MEADETRGPADGRISPSDGRSEAIRRFESTIDGEETLGPHSLFDEVKVRAAEERDCRMVFAWANDPSTRANSFNTRPIELAEHQHWYEAALLSKCRFLFIAELTDMPVALARLDLEDVGASVAEVGINVAPRHRGRGLSVPILQRLRVVAASRGIHTLVARIRAENTISIRVFERAGYRFVADEKTPAGLARRYEASLQIG